MTFVPCLHSYIEHNRRKSLYGDEYAERGGGGGDGWGHLLGAAFSEGTLNKRITQQKRLNPDLRRRGLGGGIRKGNTVLYRCTKQYQIL